MLRRAIPISINRPQFGYSRGFFRQLFKKPQAPQDELVDTSSFRSFLDKVENIERQSGNVYSGQHHVRWMAWLLIRKYYKYLFYFVIKTTYLFILEYIELVTLFAILIYI